MAKHGGGLSKLKSLRDHPQAKIPNGRPILLSTDDRSHGVLAALIKVALGAGALLEHAAKFMEVVKKLHEFETKTWDQIIGAGCHPINCAKLESKARRRLAEIQQDDLVTWN